MMRKAHPFGVLSKKRAFSMIELMIVVTIAAILMVIAIPSLQSTIARQKLTTVASDLYAAVTLTRAEAVRRGARVDLKASPAGWAGGWTVSIIQGSEENTVYRHDPVPSGILIDAPSFGNLLSYDGTGRTRQIDNSQVTVSGEWKIRLAKDVGSSLGERRLQVNRLGRPLLCTPGSAPAC